MSRNRPGPVSTAPPGGGAGPLPPAPPPLREDATPEEKDLHWFTHVYQGSRMPQLTLRAVIMGATLGMLMSVSNLYTTLKVGWSFGVAITSCVLSFVLWNALRTLLGGRVSPMSVLENNCMQSTASAAGYSTGATIATCFGALLILDPNHHHMPWTIVASFTLVTGAMGVFLAIPMKRQLINQEQLAFPSGIAAATTLRSLYSHGAEAMRKAYALVASLAVGAGVGVLNTAEDQFVALGRFFVWMRAHAFDIHMPELIPANGFRMLAGKPMVAFGFEPSVLLIAAGMIVGLRVSLSMFASALALNLVVAPWLQGLDAAQAATPGWVASIPMVGGGTLYHPVRWALWGGTSVMVFASLASLALQWRTVARSFQLLRSRRAGSELSEDVEARMAAIEVPNSWFLAGVLPLSIAMLAVQVLAFRIHWWAGLVAVGMSFVLAMVASRATGETDTTPIGAMGKVMQLVFAVLSPGNTTHNLAAAGIGANSATAAADLLTDLKSGYLLGANPRQQFLAQFVGVFFGTLAIVPAWYLMIPNDAALEKFPLPATQTWVAVARVLSSGLESLPVSARWAILVGAFVGVLIPVLEKLFPRARRWMPSAMGLGLGWVVFFSNTLSFAIGAAIAWAWSVGHRRSQETFNVPVASGLIAGESLMKALLAMLATAIGLAGRK
ncbi:MAG: OPT/YSL family transporter [Candidatus Eisenbacteria bacterium]|nr:OPT/YSL family transporter [Candidatus Eisenbacteria bacterium]